MFLTKVAHSMEFVVVERTRIPSRTGTVTNCFEYLSSFGDPHFPFFHYK